MSLAVFRPIVLSFHVRSLSVRACNCVKLKMSESNGVVVTKNVDKEALKVKFKEKISNLNKNKCSFHIKNKLT